MNRLITLLCISIFLCSCLNQKYLSKGSQLYQVRADTTGKTEIVVYAPNKKIKATIVETSGTLTIKTKDPIGSPNVIQHNFFPRGSYAELELSRNLYFPETTYPNNTPDGNTSFVANKKLCYSENKLVFQALTIPLKIRRAIGGTRYLDSLQKQVEAGFNAGFAYGFKRTWSTFRAEKNSLNQNTTNLSLAFTPFFSVGAADVKKSTTNYTISVDRKAPVLSYGTVFMFGFNNINIGYAIGWDNLLSSDKKNWVYQGKSWSGIIVALDILK